eukprot:1561756-Alexandrium_andersonii.AAC.1
MPPSSRPTGAWLETRTPISGSGSGKEPPWGRGDICNTRASSPQRKRAPRRPSAKSRRSQPT